MSQKKVIAVIGATGLQGGGLVRAILNDPNSEFSVRAVTRDLNSEEAKEFAKLGAEVVKGDIGDVESLEKAFSGAYGAFLVSFFWHHGDAERDSNEIKNMALAAKKAELQHVIYSTLEDTRNFFAPGDVNGKYRASHMDVKGEGDQFFKDLSIPTTFFITTFYFENFLNPGLRPKRYNGNALLSFPMADKLLAGIAAEDIGKSAYGIFKKGEEYIGEKVGVAGDHLTGAGYAEGLSATLNEEITYSPPTLEEFGAFDMPFGEDIANSFQFMLDFNKEYIDVRNIEFTRNVNPEVQTFKQWLAANKHLLQID